ncbi:MAG: GntR family transcriptional regulator [Candidatus Izemoplasmatales bacterium]|nr:GntR family transcriptional regulator [Candidatus Izemoplasmatales bacterium]
MTLVSNKTLQVVNDIQNKIINQELLPGTKLLPLRELATSYEASRSVINSAIQILTTKGYLTVNPRQSIIVNDLWYSGSLDIVKDIYFSQNEAIKTKTVNEVLSIRLMAELQAIDFIFANNYSDLNDLENVLNKENEALSKQTVDICEIVKLDCQFHETLVKTANNSVLFLLYMSFKEIETDMVSLFYNHHVYAKDIIKSHGELLSNIKSKELNKARILWTDLLNHGAKIMSSEKIKSKK